MISLKVKTPISWLAGRTEQGYTLTHNLSNAPTYSYISWVFIFTNSLECFKLIIKQASDIKHQAGFSEHL